MVYGFETVVITKKQVEEMEVTEMKMLRFAMGVTKKDKIRNEYIRGTIKVEGLGMKMREGRLSKARQFGRTNLAGDNLAAQICQRANLVARQFGRIINKNYLPSLALNRQQKSFVMSQRQLKRQLQMFSR